MAVVIIDGRVAVDWCTAISNLAAPTTTELNAGTRLETFITPDGLSINPTTAAVDVSNLGSKYTWKRAGRIDFAVKIKFHHDGGTDTSWNLFPYRTNGFMVVRRGIDRTTAFASTQQVEVYPLESAEPDQTDPSPNTDWDFEVDFFLTGDPQTRAVIA